MRLFCLFCAGLLYAQTPTQSTAFLLKGGTIHTMAGPVIENGSILVRDGKIIGVGKNLTPPEGVPVIDISGQQVYPGMIDAASMLGLSGLDEAPETSDAREIGEIHPQLRALSAIHPDDEQIPMTRANGVTSAVVFPEGDLLAGQLTMIHLDGSTNDGMAILPAAAMHLHFPVIKTMRVWKHEPAEEDEDPQDAIVYKPVPYREAKKEHDRQLRELNSFFEEARRYRHAKLAHSKDLKPDSRYEAMIPVLEGAMPVFVTAVRVREIREAIAFADKQKIRMILADAAEAYKAIPLIKSHNIPVVLQPTLSLPLDDDDPYDRAYTTPSDLYKAGIKFAIATFSANAVRNLPYQAAAAVPFGLPKDEAYKAVSLNAAEIFGVGKKLGSIEEGKNADLIVTNGDPLEARTKVIRVFINGKAEDLETRQKELYEKYKAR
ncbi:MAG TPA: amidohydrolase family protein [Bryobacteraceae bacterium]|nr:amidohydrolase family protein [Bryobacteraceae bacterium]